MPLTERTANTVRVVMPAVLAAAVTAHFALTLAYLVPMSPLRVATADMVNAYIEPVFTQRWTLFAPGAADKSRAMLFQCRLAGDTRSDDEIPWEDATTGLRQAHYKNRLGYADRILRGQKAGAEFLAAPADDFSSAVLKSATASNPELAKEVDQQKLRAQQNGRDIYARVASVECDREYGPGRTQDVRVRVVTETVPPFSKRNDPAVQPQREAVDLGWTPRQQVDGY